MVVGQEDDSASVTQTGRLFLRNLTYSATEADIAALLEGFGDLAEVHLVVDKWESGLFALNQQLHHKNVAIATF